MVWGASRALRAFASESITSTKSINQHKHLIALTSIYKTLRAYIADAIKYVNVLVSGTFYGRFAQPLAVNKTIPDKHWWKRRRRKEANKISISSYF